MESHSISTTSNSSSSSSALDHFSSQNNKDEKRVPYSLLHSVRKIPGKNSIMKKPIAPMPPTLPQVYKVDPVDFRDVIQRVFHARAAAAGGGATISQPFPTTSVSPSGQEFAAVAREIGC